MTQIERVLKYEEKTLFRLRALYSAYGYAPFKMSKFEEYDLYVRNKSFLVSDHIITFTDTDGKLLALKPDVTLSIVKNSRDSEGGVQKVYYDENVYRVSPRTHDYREIMQTGLECIGEVDAYLLSEVLLLAYRSLACISEDFVLDVSHLGIVSAAVEALGLSSGGRSEVLSAIAEKNVHGITAVCHAEGADAEATALLCRLVALSGAPSEVLSQLATLLPQEMKGACAELGEVLSALPADRVRIDFSVINDMSYYSGIVFRGFVNGIPSGVLSGGQYDPLMRRMGRRAGAVGFAVYLDQLEAFIPAIEEYDVDVLVLYGEKTPAARVHAAVEALVAEGKTVLARRTLPEKLTYQRLVRLDETETEVG